MWWLFVNVGSMLHCPDGASGGSFIAVYFCIVPHRDSHGDLLLVVLRVNVLVLSISIYELLLLD